MSRSKGRKLPMKQLTEEDLKAGLLIVTLPPGHTDAAQMMNLKWWATRVYKVVWTIPIDSKKPFEWGISNCLTDGWTRMFNSKAELLDHLNKTTVEALGSHWRKLEKWEYKLIVEELVKDYESKATGVSGGSGEQDPRETGETPGGTEAGEAQS